ncbi:MAG TPA: TolC family protein [Polyangiaceae bacterium]|nr:TolC family protein [Polyangiaceae bacterium]
MVWFRSTAALAACILLAHGAAAQEKRACSAQIDRENLIPCVLDASLAVRAEEASLRSLSGRRRAAGVILPSNPVLALSGARRSAENGGQRASNWSAELSQELEIAGQRGARSRAAEAELAAQKQRIILSKRDSATAAWTFYFEAIAAKHEQELAERLLEASQRMNAVARGKAQQGLIAAVDADVVEAATLRVLQAKLSATRRWAIATAELSALLGRDSARPVTVVEGELSPLLGADVPATSAASEERPETRMLVSEQQALSARADTLKRARIPNPTLSVFAQNDGFDEHVYGFGIAIPIPLPSPVGRTNAGEITELEALGQRVQVEREQLARTFGLEAATAAAEIRAHRDAVVALTPEMLERAERSLADLSEAINTGKLPVRDALIAQQALIDLLQTNLSERLELCLASVRLARALGRPLEEGAR